MKIQGPYVHGTGRLKGRKYVVAFYNDGRKKQTLYSRWLMEQALGRELLPSEHVDHKDEDPTNDEFSNLQILTPAQNSSKSARLKPRVSPRKGLEVGWTHGTTYGWQKRKCNCALCLKSRKQYQERRRLKRGSKKKYQSSSVLSEHGTRRRYRQGCHCDLCRRANADDAKQLRNKKK